MVHNKLTAQRKPIRILHVLYSMIRGGAETWLMHVLRHLPQDRFQMDFLVHNPSPGLYDAEARSLGAQIIYCPYPKWPWTYWWNLKKILRDYGPYDIIHAHISRCGFNLFLASQAGVPIRIAHSHIDEFMHLRHSNYYRKLGVIFSNYLVSRYATAGLAASQLAAKGRFGTEWESDPRWSILHCAINLSQFKEKCDSKLVRQEFGIKDDTFVIGHVGRFNEQKNHSFLVEIAAELSKMEPNFRLLLVGDGALRSEIEKQVSALRISDKVIFTGVRPDVPRLMVGAMDVFLFPSFYEGNPLVLMEAQAAGLPCVISETITEEIDVIKPLFNRLSLSLPASAWAKATLVARGKKEGISQSVALELIEQTDYNVVIGCKKLQDIYSGLVL